MTVSREAPEKCPKCGGMLYRKKGKNQLICKTEGCGYKVDIQNSEDSGETETNE